MNDFNPGDGWREVTEREWLQTPIDSDQVTFYADGRQRRWVREEPVPPLPTEPYTVIRVTWSRGARAGANDVLVHELGGWCDLDGTIYTYAATAASITGFEVLAEPRDVGYGRGWNEGTASAAKAVLDRVLNEWANIPGLPNSVKSIASEFGVES